MTKVLITGGAGFIGGYLAKQLKSESYEVILCDLPNKYSKDLLQEYECIECDITSKKDVDLLPPVDIVYHLAGHVGTASSLKNMNRDLECNALGTLNIARYVIDNNIKKFCFSSSMAVYGHAEKVIESVSPAPVSPYGISKLCAENYVNYVSLKKPSTQCVIYRIFNCYGPGQDTKNLTQGLASIFIEQVKRGNSVEVTGRLDRERDLIYIEDVVSALMMVTTNDDMDGIYNLCSGQDISISSLIDLIAKTSNLDKKNIEKKNIGGTIEDSLIVTGDTTKLTSHGWKPKTNLVDGIRKCWEAHRE